MIPTKCESININNNIETDFIVLRNSPRDMENIKLNANNKASVIRMLLENPLIGNSRAKFPVEMKIPTKQMCRYNNVFFDGNNFKELGLDFYQ